MKASISSAIIVAITAPFLLFAGGCGGDKADCSAKLTAITIMPPTATANHVLAAPGNSQDFQAFNATPLSIGCAAAAVVTPLTGVTWTVSDPANVSIAPATDINGQLTAGRATCMGATNGAVTITGTVDGTNGQKVSNTAKLTCQ